MTCHEPKMPGSFFKRGRWADVSSDQGEGEEHAARFHGDGQVRFRIGPNVLDFSSVEVHVVEPLVLMEIAEDSAVT